MVLRDSNKQKINGTTVSLGYNKKSLLKQSKKSCESTTEGKCVIKLSVRLTMIQETTLVINNLVTPSGYTYDSGRNTKKVIMNSEKEFPGCSLFSSICPTYNVSFSMDI